MNFSHHCTNCFVGLLCSFVIRIAGRDYCAKCALKVRRDG